MFTVFFWILKCFTVFVWLNKLIFSFHSLFSAFKKSISFVKQNKGIKKRKKNKKTTKNRKKVFCQNLFFTDAQSTKNCSLEVGHSKEPGNDNFFVVFFFELQLKKVFFRKIKFFFQRSVERKKREGKIKSNQKMKKEVKKLNMLCEWGKGCVNFSFFVARRIFFL